MAPNMTTVTLACLLASASAFVVAPMRSSSNLQMAATKPHQAAAAAAAAAIVLGGASMAPLPASAAINSDTASTVASSVADAAKSNVGSAARDIADSAKQAGGDGATFQEGADLQARNAEANIGKARDTVSSTVADASSNLRQRDQGSSGGTPSKLNPKGSPTFADGVAQAKGGAKDNVGRIGDAVNDAQRGVTQRDGAVDAIKDNARASAPFFGKLANEGVNKMSNTRGGY